MAVSAHTIINSAWPGRVLQQRASDQYQVEFAAFQPREQFVQRRGSGALTLKGFVDVTGQVDGADGDGGDARELLRLAWDISGAREAVD